MKRKNKIENSKNSFFSNLKKRENNIMNIENIKKNYKKEIYNSISKFFETKTLKDLNAAIKDAVITRSTTEWYVFKITTSQKEHVIKYKDVNFLHHLLMNYSLDQLHDFIISNSYYTENMKFQ